MLVLPRPLAALLHASWRHRASLLGIVSSASRLAGAPASNVSARVRRWNTRAQRRRKEVGDVHRWRLSRADPDHPAADLALLRLAQAESARRILSRRSTASRPTRLLERDARPARVARTSMSTDDIAAWISWSPRPRSALVGRRRPAARVLDRDPHAAVRQLGMDLDVAPRRARVRARSSSRTPPTSRGRRRGRRPARSGVPWSQTRTASRTRSSESTSLGMRRWSGRGATASRRTASSAMSSPRSSLPTMRSRMCSTSCSGSRGPARAASRRRSNPSSIGRAAALDQAVGVEEQHRADRQLDDVLGVRRVGAGARAAARGRPPAARRVRPDTRRAAAGAPPT